MSGKAIDSEVCEAFRSRRADGQSFDQIRGDDYNILEVVTHLKGYCECNGSVEAPEDRLDAAVVEMLREQRADGLSLTQSRRRENGLTYKALAEDVDSSIFEVLYYVRGHAPVEFDVPPVDELVSDRNYEDQGWREKPVMEALFHDRNLFFTEMAEILGCHDETARNWVSEHELSPDGTHHTSSKLVRQLQQIEVDPYQNLSEITNGADAE